MGSRWPMYVVLVPVKGGPAGLGGRGGAYLISRAPPTKAKKAAKELQGAIVAEDYLFIVVCAQREAFSHILAAGGEGRTTLFLSLLCFSLPLPFLLVATAALCP